MRAANTRRRMPFGASSALAATLLFACSPHTAAGPQAGTPAPDTPPPGLELPLPITRPNGGETWAPGAAVRVTWDPRGAANGFVDLHLLKGEAVLRTIATRTPNDGEHVWVVPRGHDDETDYRVRLTAYQRADASDATFRIGAPNVTDYFPLERANGWTYETGDGGRVTMRVRAEPGEINGVATRVLADDSGREEWYTVDDAGWRLHRLVLPEEPQTLTFDPPLQLAAATLVLGDTARTSGVATTAAGAEAPTQAPYQCAVRVEGFPTITLPGGRTETVKLAGLLLMGNSQRVLFTLWCAPGVGRVQHTGDRTLTFVGAADPHRDGVPLAAAAAG